MSNDGIYDGYFALGGDINYNGTYVPPMVLNYSERGNTKLGFRGVFDGRGYTINGMKVESARWDTAYGNSETYRWTGFISVLNKNGIIKDVAFTNAGVQYCSFLSSWGGGLVENVYIGYTGNYASSYNATVNSTRDSAPAVILHNCVISYDTAWTSGQILGKVNDTANAYRNVYIVGHETNIVSYYSTLRQKDNVIVNYPLENDNFDYYSSVGELLAERKNEISGWNYFSADETFLSFGSYGSLLTATTAVSKNYEGNVIISADKTSSDYIIVYEDGNEYALNAAAFIAEHIARASGKVAYSKITSGERIGGFTEEVSGGINLPVTTKMPAEFTDSCAYIVIGKNGYANAPSAEAGKFVIKTIGNSVFISADSDDDYITAAIKFLKEAIGYLALSDDIVYYEKATGEVTMPSVNISFDSAFNRRNTTNAYHVWKNDQLGINARKPFPIGPQDENGNVYSFHNAIYWLNYSANKTAHSKWFRTADNGVIDICYYAGGSSQSSANTEYVAMVAEAANSVRALLDANPGVTNVTFSLMDNDLNGCSCSGCSKGRTNAAVNFLNDVVKKIQDTDGNTDRDFTIYMLAYYYLIDAPTVAMNEHLGVIYAPVRNSYEALSIYDSKNDSVRNQISAWLTKTSNIGFWFYSTLFHNYMMFTDMTESLITWFEYAARACKNAGVEPTWVTVNGQTKARNASVFEAFKQYAFANAQVDVLERITAQGGTESYKNQVSAYVLELESEFFAFTVNGTTKIFREGGYYGAANANKEMYNLYTKMKADYAGISETNDGTTVECLDRVYDSENGWLSHTSGCAYLSLYVSNKHTKGYFKNFGQGTVKTYLAYVNNAIAAIEAYSGSMKEVYKQHVLAESLAPRFMMCVSGDNTSYRDQAGYTEADIKTMRAELKADFASLGISNYGEHTPLSDLYSIWGI